MVKRIAIYGTFMAYESVYQRYWMRRRDGVLQRYRKRTSRKKRVFRRGRYEFHGSGRDLYHAVLWALEVMPKGYIEVSARKFLHNPYKYGVKGMWVDREVES